MTMPRDTHDGRSMRRRRFLLAAGGIGTAATAGCLSELGFEQQSARVPSLVEDRPDAVYHPTHVEAMEMVGMESAGPYTVALSYSFPHRFWTVTGRNRTKVTIDGDDSMHLMASLWHEETGVVPPTGSVSFTIERDGETVDPRTPWSMLSQRMGFHFGDNLALPESGTYEVTVDVDPVGTRTTGALREAFEEPETATFSMEFDPGEVRSLEFTQFPDEAGSRTAIGPMDMPGPGHSQLPPAGDLPGRAIGEGRSGDGVFLVRALDSPPAGIDASGTYLAISARTPYNRYPLALMSLSATLEAGDETRFSGSLTPTLDPDLGYHYGATVDAVESGDSIAIDVGAVPQVSRHEGYETAFFEMESMTIEA
jgi:hypothetical protein